MSLGHQKQMSGNPLGSQQSMKFGHQNKCQETFWALKKHEFWAPKTKVRKLAGLSKSMSFGTKTQMSGNPPGSLKQYMNFGHQNKCQETFWALQKHEFWTPTTNVRKLAGISKTCALGAKNKCQETRRALKQPVQEFCAPKANVGAVKKHMSLGHQKQMSRNPLGSQKSMRFEHQNKCQETFWAFQKNEFCTPTTNVRKLAGISKKNMCFGRQKQMSGNSPDSQTTCTRVVWTKSKCRGCQKKHKSWAPKTNVRKPIGLSKKA